jgi:hypothetical protein
MARPGFGTIANSTGTDAVDRNAYTTGSLSLTTDKGYLIGIVTPREDSTSPATPTITGWSAHPDADADFLWDSGGGFRCRLTVLYRYGDNSNTTHSIDYAGATQAGCLWGVVEVPNPHLTGATFLPTDCVQSLTASTTTPTSGTLASLGADSGALVFVNSRSGTPDIVPDSGWTELFDIPLSTGGGTQNLAAYYRNDDSDLQWSGTGGNEEYASVIAEIVGGSVVSTQAPRSMHLHRLRRAA